MILFGSRGYLRVMAIVNFVCNNCHNPAAQRIVERVTKFTLFFVPLFPIGKSYTATCTFCGLATRLTKQQAEQYVSYSQGPQATQVQPGQAQYGGARYGNAPGVGPVQEQLPVDPGYGPQS